MHMAVLRHGTTCSLVLRYLGMECAHISFHIKYITLLGNDNVINLSMKVSQLCLCGLYTDYNPEAVLEKTPQWYTGGAVRTIFQPKKL